MTEAFFLRHCPERRAHTVRQAGAIFCGDACSVCYFHHPGTNRDDAVKTETGHNSISRQNIKSILRTSRQHKIALRRPEKHFFQPRIWSSLIYNRTAVNQHYCQRRNQTTKTKFLSNCGDAGCKWKRARQCTRLQKDYDGQNKCCYFLSLMPQLQNEWDIIIIGLFLWQTVLVVSFLTNRTKKSATTTNDNFDYCCAAIFALFPFSLING